MEKLRALFVAAKDVESLTHAAGQAGISASAHVKTQPQGVSLLDYIGLQQSLSHASPDETFTFSKRPLMVGTADFALERLSQGKSASEGLEAFAHVYNLAHGGPFNYVEMNKDRLAYLCKTDHFPFTHNSGREIEALMESILIYVHAALDLRTNGHAHLALLGVRTRRLKRTIPDGLLAFWEAPVKLKAASFGLDYDVSILNQYDWTLPFRPVRLDDVHRHMRHLIHQREAAPGEGELGDMVAMFFEQSLASQSMVAANIGISTATLRRRLGRHGISFRTLKVSALNIAAKRALAQGKSVTAVAEALGYSDLRSFTRAFKVWNQMPPSQYSKAISALLDLKSV